MLSSQLTPRADDITSIYRINVQRPFLTCFPGKAHRYVCDVTDRDQDRLKYCQNTEEWHWSGRKGRPKIGLGYIFTAQAEGSLDYYTELPKNNFHFKHTSYILRFIIITIIHIWRFKKLCSILSFASARWTWTEEKKKTFELNNVIGSLQSSVWEPGRY